MRILLIEDSARLRGLVCEAIRNEGWKIDAFATAQDGRIALREGSTTCFSWTLVFLTRMASTSSNRSGRLAVRRQCSF